MLKHVEEQTASQKQKNALALLIFLTILIYQDNLGTQEIICRVESRQAW